MRRIKILVIFFLFVFLIFSMGDNPSGWSIAKEKEAYPHLELLAKVIATIQQKYVGEVEVEKLIIDALEGMVSSLDPYSQFMTPDVKKEMELETKGEFGGVGMVITRRDDIITVVSPIEDTPAFRAGIQSEDKIVEIDGEPTKGWTTWQAAKKLRGEPGSQVTIKVRREGEKDLLTFELTREIIHIKSVKNVRIIKDDIGYIRITAFREDTAKNLREALTQLLEQGANSLILDVRNNPGGLLDVAVEVADEFLPKGKLIVFIKGREGKEERKYFSRNDPIFPHGHKVVILINKGSASASEIVAGTLKKSGIATLVGTDTFGKGSVQSIIGLDDKYALRLTTAHYYIDEDKTIEGEGIKPDIEVEISKEERAKILEALEGYKKEDIPDPQLEKAIEYLTEPEIPKTVDSTQ
ncbi:MAG TPA: S41 family peptidase [Candidatus Omnitrophica bacterium]|nr:S41 family peptidase [Candidatus Omnitrophota bacterium]